MSGESIHISDVIDVIKTDFPEMSLSSSGGGDTDEQSPTDAPPGADGQPYVTIMEEPAMNEARFRYKCEGRSAGSIPGQSSSKDHKTSPTIQIHNYRGRAIVVVSCVTKDKPYRPHPHNLVGKEGCNDGICTVEVASNDMIIQFPNLGIQCVKKNEVEESLRKRERKKLDPFGTGFEHATQPSSIDLNVVRLCFQVFLPGSGPKCFDKPLKPIVSSAIYDKKSVFDLQIHRLSHASAPVGGGLEMILLCEKVTKEDIEVHFFETSGDQVVWSEKADFQPINVHKQVAITFRTPVYKNKEVENPVKVQIKLYRPSDGAYSKAVDFLLTPLDSDLKRKKSKTSNASVPIKNMPVFEDSMMPMRASPDHSHYPVKQEPAEPGPILYGSSLSPMYVGSASPHSVPAVSPQMPVGRTPSPMEYQLPQNAALGPFPLTSAYQPVSSSSRVVTTQATNIPIKVRNLHAGGTFTSFGSTSPVYQQEMMLTEPGTTSTVNQQTFSNLSPLPYLSSLSPVPPTIPTSVSPCPPNSMVTSLGIFSMGVDPSVAPPAPEACPVTDISSHAATLNVGLNSQEFASVSYWDGHLSDQISSNLNLTEDPEPPHQQQVAGDQVK